ncbi:MAG: hypothetical protein ACRD3M_08740 [Thermoanaerobaculia bacterium]
MRTASALALVVALAAAGAGCGRPGDRAPSRQAGESSPSGGLLRAQPLFRPPADGLLTDEQVERFLRVRRAAKGRTDAESARALGVSAEEVAWTRARVIEALAALDEKRVRDASVEAYGKALAGLRSARASARDSGEASLLDQQIAALERERAAVRREETAPPALAGNLRKVADRRAELDAVAP